MNYKILIDALEIIKKSCVNRMPSHNHLDAIEGIATNALSQFHSTGKEKGEDREKEIEEKDNFAISFAVWALHNPDAKALQAAGITAYGLLEKYKSRPYIEHDTSKQ